MLSPEQITAMRQKAGIPAQGLGGGSSAGAGGAPTGTAPSAADRINELRKASGMPSSASPISGSTYIGKDIVEKVAKPFTKGVFDQYGEQANNMGSDITQGADKLKKTGDIFDKNPV